MIARKLSTALSCASLRLLRPSHITSTASGPFNSTLTLLQVRHCGPGTPSSTGCFMSLSYKPMSLSWTGAIPQPMSLNAGKPLSLSNPQPASAYTPHTMSLHTPCSMSLPTPQPMSLGATANQPVCASSARYTHSLPPHTGAGAARAVRGSRAARNVSPRAARDIRPRAAGAGYNRGLPGRQGQGAWREGKREGRDSWDEEGEEPRRWGQESMPEGNELRRGGDDRQWQLPREGQGQRATGGERQWQGEGQREWKREGPRQWDREGQRQRPGEGQRRWQGEGQRQWQGEGQRQWQGEGQRQWQGEGQRQWDREEPRQWDREGPRQWEREGPRPGDRGGQRQWDRDGPKQWERDGLRQWGEERSAQSPGPRQWQREGPRQWQEDRSGQRQEQRDGPRQWVRDRQGGRGVEPRSRGGARKQSQRTSWDRESTATDTQKQGPSKTWDSELTDTETQKQGPSKSWDSELTDTESRNQRQSTSWDREITDTETQQQGPSRSWDDEITDTKAQDLDQSRSWDREPTDTSGAPPPRKGVALQYFATCHPGMEAVVAAELRAPCIGALEVTTGKSGVYFSGTLLTGYRANLWLRSAVKVLVQLASERLPPGVPAGDSLYSFVRRAAPWESLLADPREDGHRGTGPRARTFRVDARVWDCENLTSSDLASLRAKDAVCDAMRDACGGAKPPAPARDAPPDLPLLLSVYRDTATLYRDMSGASLHKRGYRSAMHKASLNESVAAAMLLLASWDRVALLPGAQKVASTSDSSGVSTSKSSTGSDSRTGAVDSEDRARSESDLNSDGDDSGSDGVQAGLADPKQAEILQTDPQQAEPGQAESSEVDSPVAEPTQAASPQAEASSGAAGSGSSGDAAGIGSSGVVIVDPMCGSGTLLIEAALLATRTAPGLFRNSWPFQTWHDFDPALWEQCLREAESQRQACPLGVRFLGNDIHAGALSLCERDAEAAGVSHLLQLSCGDVAEYVPASTPSLVVVNPPWGSRLTGTSGDEGAWLEETWYTLGQFLRKQCANAEAYIVSGNPTVTKKLFMKAAAKWPVGVGGIECRILLYHVLPKREPRSE